MSTSDEFRRCFDEAQAMLKRGDYEACEHACDRLLRQETNADVVAARTLAQAFRGRSFDAVATLRSTVGRDAAVSPYCLYALALATQMTGNLQEALRVTDTALEALPDNDYLVQTRCSLLIDLGRYDEAYITLQRLGPGTADPTENARLLSFALRRLSRPQEALPVLDQALASPKISDMQKQSLLFEKGAALDASGRYDEAFEAASAANRLERRRFDPLLLTDAIERTIRYWNVENFANAPANQTEGATTIFLVGMPRSGSTLLEQMLDRHSAIEGAGEYPWLIDAAREIEPYNLEQYGTIVDPRRISEDQIRNLATHYHRNRKKTGPGPGIISDKTLTNYKLVGLIAKAFPKAVVIWCQRSPLDTILSCYLQNFLHNEPYASLANITKQFHDSERLLIHWRDTLGIPILEVSYENIVQDPRAQISRILEHLDLPWEEACLTFHASRRFARTASKHQVKRPIYRSSVGRWKNYDRHLATVKLMLDAYGHDW